MLVMMSNLLCKHLVNTIRSEIDPQCLPESTNTFELSRKPQVRSEIIRTHNAKSEAGSQY